jgi:hypothetical protein
MSITDITVGQGGNTLISFENLQLANASFSPVSNDINFVGTSFTVPLIWALNITGLLFLITCGVVMLVYSVLPAKPYSKHLLGFAYKKPLFTIILFVIPLLAFPLILQMILNVSLPLNGTATVELPMNFFGGEMTASAVVSAGFLWPFWLAIVAAVLCIAARVYHRKVAYVPEAKPAEAVAPQPAAPAAAPETPKSQPEPATPEPAAPSEPTTPAPTAPT